MKTTLLKISVSALLCTYLFSSTTLHAEETKNYNSGNVQEIAPRYSQVVSSNTTFRYQNNTYTLYTSWVANIENNSGRLSSASFVSASSNLPDPLYQSTSVVSSTRLNDYQIRYNLRVKIMRLGVTQSTISTSVVVNSSGPA